MELSTNQGRALRKKGRMRLVRKSRPISQMLLLRLGEGMERLTANVDFVTLHCPLPPRTSAQLVRVPGTCCKQNS